MQSYVRLLMELKGSTICASIIVERFNNNLLKYNRITTIRSYLNRVERFNRPIVSKYNGITIIRLIQLKGSTIYMASQAYEHCSYFSTVERFNNVDLSKPHHQSTNSS